MTDKAPETSTNSNDDDHLWGETLNALMREEERLRPQDLPVRLEDSDGALRRFWPKVDTSGGPDACWPWTAAANQEGRGRFSLYGSRKVPGKDTPVARMMLELYEDRRPSNEFAMHSCDNANCVNPRHLTYGSAAQNAADAVSRGRVARGMALPHSKLTDAHKAEIVLLRQQGVSVREIAGRFGVGQTAIRSVLKATGLSVSIAK